MSKKIKQLIPYIVCGVVVLAAAITIPSFKATANGELTEKQDKIIKLEEQMAEIQSTIKAQNEENIKKNDEIINLKEKIQEQQNLLNYQDSPVVDTQDNFQEQLNSHQTQIIENDEKITAEYIEKKDRIH